ncbi:MAG: aspartate aminotransferase family protein [Coriobacteriia bacterium]|nr:aspartate aminotransferase family protein [Coriobacteriia bacterium]
MSLTEQQELESAYVMNTFARKPVEFVSGQGMKLYDDQGKEYLDFIAGIGACSLGHCHPALTQAIQEQAGKLIHVSNYYYIEKRGQVSQLISELLNSGSEQPETWKTFYANSGAEANECSIKLARLYARNKHVAAGNDPATAPRTVVVLKRSFHGRTLATLAATAQEVKQELFQPLPDGFVSTPINDVDALQSLFSQMGDQICAVMIEVVQGESGVNPCSAEFMQAIRDLTTQHGATMICDEVQCGIYRAGAPFAFQKYGIVPDIVSMAKGIAGGFPCGASAARAEVADAYEPGTHGSTFGGSNLAIASMYATLSTLKDGGFSESVQEVGDYFRVKLEELPQAKEVRGLGLMLAVDLADDVKASAPEVVAAGLEAGLVLNYTGPRTLRFLPPLIATKEDVDAMLDALKPLLA